MSDTDAPMKLTDLERQVVLGIQARHRAIDLEAALLRQAIDADHRAFEAALAERLGLPADAIAGNRYAVNTQMWTLEPTPAPEAPPDGQ